jgi:phosphatidyl-myo-inositol dimannoside synthase
VILNIGVIGNGLLAYLLKLFHLKIIIISYAEEITMAAYSSGFKGFIKQLFLSLYKKTNAVVSVSNFAKNILIKDINVQSPVYVIPTPLHQLKNIQSDKKITKNINQILSLGRLIKRKGFNHLISAFNKVIQTLPDAQLVMVGDGPDYDYLYNEIQKLNLGNSIIIYRNIKDKELASLYSESKIFVLANLLLKNGDYEGAPNVIVEAAPFGLPVIAGIMGGTSDVVEDGVTGYLINPENHITLSDKIISLLEDRKLREQMSENSINKAFKDHNQVSAGEKFKKIINSI